MRVDMDHVGANRARIGAIALLAAALICGACGESAAQTVERSSTELRATASRGQGAAAPVVPSEQPAGLGPMRYYGGPKSPMWRGPLTSGR
jgi:hypothetical protein